MYIWSDERWECISDKIYSQLQPVVLTTACDSSSETTSSSRGYNFETRVLETVSTFRTSSEISLSVSTLSFYS